MEKNFEELNLRQMLSMDRACEFISCIQKSIVKLTIQTKFFKDDQDYLYTLTEPIISSKTDVCYKINSILDAYYKQYG